MIKVFIVAEVACQHGGSVALAKDYVDVAKVCGCDAVKLQFYKAYYVIDFERRRVAEGKVSYYTEEIFEGVRRAEFTLEQMADVRDYCKNVGIKFVVTPFIMPELVDDLEKINPDIYKIRERDSENYQLIDRCLETGKSVFVSTTKLPFGMSYLYHPQIKFLYTIPKYPAKLEEMELGRLEVFNGISNHVPNILAPLASAVIACEHGKSEWIIECHFTLHRDINNLDKAVSIDPQEMKELVRMLNTLEAIKTEPSSRIL